MLEVSATTEEEDGEYEAKEQLTPKKPLRSGEETQDLAVDAKPEREEAEPIAAKVTFPETNASPPLSPTGHTVTGGESQREDERRSPSGDGALSSARDVFPNSADKFLLHERADVNVISDNCAPHDEIKFSENNASVPTLESRISVDDMNAKNESNLAFRNAPWEESTDVAEVVCETEESDDDESLKISLLEEWTSRPKMEDSQSPAWSCEDLYGECEQQMDHSYSRLKEKDAETHNRTVVLCGEGEETQENSHSGENGASLVKAANGVTLQNGITLQNGVSPLRGFLLPPDGEDSPFSETGRIEGPNNWQSPLPRDEGLAASAKENQALLAEANDFGHCNASVSVRSPLYDDASDSEPESGEGGLSPTVPGRNQKTENLDFLEANLSLRSFPHNKEELPLASQNGGAAEGGEARHGPEVTPTEDDTAEACHLHDLCSALEECCTVSGVPKIIMETNADGEEMRDDFAPSTAEANEGGPRNQESEKQTCGRGLSKSLRLVKDPSERKDEKRHAPPLCSSAAAATATVPDCSGLKADLNSDSLGCVEQQERSLILEDVCSKGPGERGRPICRMEIQPLLNEDYSEEQEVEDVTQDLLCTPEETQICISEEQQVEEATQDLLHTAEETQIHISEEQEVDYITQDLLRTTQETQIRISEEQQVDDITQDLLRTTQETQIHNSEEQEVDDIRISEEQEVDDVTQDLLHTSEETQIRISEEQQLEEVTQDLLHTAEETQICISEEQQVEEVTQDLLRTTQETQIRISEEQQVDDITQDLLHTTQETQIRISEEQQVDDTTQDLLHTTQETQIRISEEQEVDDVTQDLLRTTQETQTAAILAEETQTHLPRLARLHRFAQPLQDSEMSREDKPSAAASPSPETPSCAKEPIMLFDRESGHLVNWAASENEDGSSSVKEDTHPGRERIPLSLGAAKQGTEETISLLCGVPDPSKDIKRSSGDDQRKMVSSIEKMELPVPSCSDARDSAGTLLRDSAFHTGEEEETMFSFEDETQVRLLGGTSEFGSGRSQDPSETPMAEICPETEGVFPASSPENFSGTSSCILELPPECPSSEGRHSQDIGERTKPSVSQSVILEVGDCAEFTPKEQTPARFVSRFGAQERMREKAAKTKGPLKRRRTLEVGRPLSSSSLRTAVKPAQQSPSVAEDMDNGALCGNFGQPKRPKRFDGPIKAGHAEAKSPSNLGSLVPTFCASQAVGLRQCAYRLRKHLSILRRRPKKPYLKVPTPCHFEARKRPPSMTGTTFLGSSSEFRPKLLSPARFPPAKYPKVVIWDRAPKPKGLQTSLLLDVFRPSRRTKETALLRKMSLLADKLLAPPRNPRKFTPLPNPPAPRKYGQFGSKMLPEPFSSFETKSTSSLVNASDSRCFKKFSSPSFWVCALESAAMCIFELSGKTPFAFGAPAFPTSSYHVKTEPFPTKSLQSVPHGSAWRETRTRPPSEWSVSVLWSQNVAGVVPVHKETRVLTLLPSGLNATKDGRYTIAYHTSGLQTVLALFFPGCWRLWSRKRHPPGRFPSARRLTFLRFTGASKDSNFSSTFGGELPLWNRLDPPSASPSEISPLCSPRCAWKQESIPATATLCAPQRGLGLQNRSSAMLPPLPDRSLEVSVAPKNDIRWELSFSASFPTSFSIPESARSRLGLSPPRFPVRPSDESDVPVPAFPDINARRKEVKEDRIQFRGDLHQQELQIPAGDKVRYLVVYIGCQNFRVQLSLETIFEEPKERNGSLISVSHQKRKRILEFQDFTVPRKRRARGRVKVTAGFTRAQKAASEGRELDGLLIQRLTDLETFLAAQEELADAPGS
ncbi:hypothetical protein JD844_015081 [Phrynosoma platyrhinos]|uniref:Tantalus-like domain-containing protein n=1 Tax=Phrynosoma platyrhinos TaxID=52577 RepID=A0ABQ7T7U9_PHRPL|nr:hypothetical protein JD844_015081 [Phrynosoma platyrhinos]